MKELKSAKKFRGLAIIAALFGMMLVSFPRNAYGQQEVDPSWYDPSGASNTAAEHPAKTQKVVKQQQKKVAATATKSSQHTAKLRSKRSATQARPS